VGTLRRGGWEEEKKEEWNGEGRGNFGKQEKGGEFFSFFHSRDREKSPIFLRIRVISKI